MTTIKKSIYDGIPLLSTPDLKMLNILWAGMCERRKETPKRHDYIGKCLLRSTLELEKRKKTPYKPAKINP